MTHQQTLGTTIDADVLAEGQHLILLADRSSAVVHQLLKSLLLWCGGLADLLAVVGLERKAVAVPVELQGQICRLEETGQELDFF